MKKKWECFSADSEKVNKIMEENNVCSLLAKILVKLEEFFKLCKFKRQ